MRIITIISLIFVCSVVKSINLEISDHIVFKEYECMAKTLHHEARGETSSGLIAVANVVINRTLHRSYPKTICGVVYQKNQFSWVGRTKAVNLENISPKVKLIAYEAVLNNSWKDNTNGALFFHTITNKNMWNKKSLQPTAKIGNHVFFKYRN